MNRLALLILLALLAAAPPRLRAQDFFSQDEDIIPPDIGHMYVRGIQYLAEKQNPDGSWDAPFGNEPAVVGLCMLSMLAHGEDPNYGPYTDNVHRALDFVLKNQDPNTGYIGTSMYNHGFGTLALAEAYGYVHDDRIGPALQKAVDLILNSQSRNASNAWRYSPDSPDADTTVSGAQMVALFAARNAGIGVPEDAIRKALRFFADCQTADGGIGYTAPTAPDGARTAIGALVFSLAKQQKSAAFRSAAQYLEANPSDEGGYHQYYLYYAAQAYFRISPQVFDAWNAQNVKTLAADQLDDGSWSSPLGPTFSTAASLLSLALNYRLLPIYER
jgi:squalene cyclase